MYYFLNKCFDQWQCSVVATKSSRWSIYTCSTYFQLTYFLEFTCSLKFLYLFCKFQEFAIETLKYILQFWKLMQFWKQYHHINLMQFWQQYHYLLLATVADAWRVVSTEDELSWFMSWAL